jgi:adenylate cyclase
VDEKMTETSKHRPITIDLNQFKLHIDLKKRIDLTLHFDSPSRRFYLSVIAFVVNEMKRLGKITSIPLEKNHDLLVLLNDTVGGSAGSSEMENLQYRIYRKWKNALPNLEEAPLFKVLGRKKQYDEGVGKTYPFTDAEKDDWANLFEYIGSEKNVRLKFALDKIGADLNDVDIIYEDSINGDAWDRFLSSLQKKVEKVPETKTIEPISEAPEPPVSPAREQRRGLLQSRYHRMALIAVVVAIVGAATWGIWELASKPAQANKASIKRMAFPLPDKPSIAVMPFVNMSEDPKQEFLADGITESIITAFSKVRNLFVISRQSTFFYKGKHVKVKQVSEELGVRYVLEGSVQRSGDRIRISAQLIDALTGYHLWAERYDRDVTDLFALQDEITMKILTAIQVKLTEGEHASSAEKYYRGKQGLDCYLKLTEARGIQFRWNIESNNLARRMIEDAIALCPENPMGYIHLAWIYHYDFVLVNTESPRETIEKGIELAQKALAMDDSIALAHMILCYLYLDKGDNDKAMTEAERAVALNPGDWAALNTYANCLRLTGRSEEAIPFYQKAIRLTPFGASVLYRDFGYALLATGRFEEAISAYKKAIQLSPNDITAHIALAITYAIMDRENEARSEGAEVLRIDPKFSVERFVKNNVPPGARRDRTTAALLKAGLK